MNKACSHCNLFCPSDFSRMPILRWIDIAARAMKPTSAPAFAKKKRWRSHAHATKHRPHGKQSSVSRCKHALYPAKAARP
eukprot:2761303-Amphidinium_carterae.1